MALATFASFLVNPRTGQAVKGHLGHKGHYHTLKLSVRHRDVGATESGIPSNCTQQNAGVYRAPAGRAVVPPSWAFKIRTTARIVFQLRVVAGTPNKFSIWPR
jgi:hypothetical protein